MPFDGTTPAKPQLAQISAAQSALVLDVVEVSFRDGAKWARGTYSTLDGRRCLLEAVQVARRQIGAQFDRAPDYLARAIRLRRGYGDLYLGTEGTVLAFNDARRRSWRQIAAVIRKAKALAEADAQHLPPADRHFAILCEMAAETLPPARRADASLN
jgi:hypothetical protein